MQRFRRFEPARRVLLKLPEPQYDVIDPAALDQLFAGRDTAGCVRVTYCGYRVTAYSDGTVDVDPLPDLD
jgi:hypothetical protein